MGCKISCGKYPDSKNEKSSEEMESNQCCLSQRPNFTESQKQLVRDTWKIVRDDIAKVGVITFLRLFEKFPNVQDLFVPFRGLNPNELRHNVRLREHGLRVMGTIEKCITRLDKPAKFELMLTELGEKHVMFDTKAEYFDLLSPQLMDAIKPAIGEKWTPEVEEAWTVFLKVVVCIMKDGLLS